MHYCHEKCEPQLVISGFVEMMASTSVGKYLLVYSFHAAEHVRVLHLWKFRR